VANEKNNHSQLSICRRRDVAPAPVPAAPETIALLRTLLSQPAADLHAITQAFESDLGLTVRLFQLAAQQPGTVPPGVFDISEIVVHLGLKKVRAMISRNIPVQSQLTVSLLTS
jgi:HD-like signal output (HDOD) protein